MMGLVTAGSTFSQTIPVDSMYLGQTPPDNNPVIFHLPVAAGSFAAERIAVSNDNREIYYTGIKNYYPTRGDTIKCYRYTGDRWTGPFNLFDNFLAPALTVKGDSMFCQDNSMVYRSYYSVRNDAGWSAPRRVLAGLNSAHYLQQARNGNFFISSIAAAGLGGNDWCRVVMNGADTAAECLGLPVSSGADNLDFFVARDESFMILAKGGLKVSFHKEDGTWTNPKDLGPKINFGAGMWGPFVSADNKYLFYTTGLKPDYSDTYVYWVRVDHLLDSLRYTNFTPYVKNPVPGQDAMVGRLFRYTLPDSIFVDDDGNHTLTCTAKLSNGTPLPGWLSWDSTTVTLTGIPDMIQTNNVRIIATDPAGASVNATFRITVAANNAIDSTGDHGFRIYPNPARNKLHVMLDDPDGKPSGVRIFRMDGRVVHEVMSGSEATIDLSGIPRGIYILATTVRNQPVYERLCVY